MLASGRLVEISQMVFPWLTRPRGRVDLQATAYQKRLARRGQRHSLADLHQAVAGLLDSQNYLIPHRHRQDPGRGEPQALTGSIQHFRAFRRADDFHRPHPYRHGFRWHPRQAFHPVAVLGHFPTRPADESRQHQGRHPYGETALATALASLKSAESIRQIGRGRDFPFGNPWFADVADDFVQL